MDDSFYKLTVSPIPNMGHFLQDRTAYLDQVWPRPPTQQTAVKPTNVGDFDSYFEFFTQERNIAATTESAVESYEDLLFIIKILQNHGPLELRQIIATIENGRPALAGKVTKLSHCIELAIRLWLMVNIRIIAPSDIFQHQTSIPWQDGDSLSKALASQFKHHRVDQTAKFSEFMNLYDMKRIGGIRIEWTNNLALHLTMKGSLIYIFHGVAVLKRMIDSGSST